MAPARAERDFVILRSRTLLRRWSLLFAIVTVLGLGTARALAYLHAASKAGEVPPTMVLDTVFDSVALFLRGS
jgi:hypothetical protein